VEFASLADYDQMYPDTADSRSRYRSALLADSGITVLDGIHVTNERAFAGKPAQIQRPAAANEQRDVQMQTMNFSSETDAVLRKLARENEQLKAEKENLTKRKNVAAPVDHIPQKRERVRPERPIQVAPRPESPPEDVERSKGHRKAPVADLDNRHPGRSRGHRKHNIDDVENEDLEGAREHGDREGAYLENHESSEQLAKLVDENEQLRQQVGSLRKSRTRDHRPEVRDARIDRDKTALIGQLMAENALFRTQLGLDPLEYKDVDTLPGEQIDAIISQLLDHNQLLREELRKVAQGPPVERDKRRDKHEIYRDLSGNRDGCTFWVPLKPEEQKRDQENATNRVKQLPISVLKKPKSKGCKKCENAILMLARVPRWPPDALSVVKGCDEFHMVESWIATCLNTRITLTELSKGDFATQFIAKERTMPNLHLVVMETEDAAQLVVRGISSSVVVAEHMRFIAQQLSAKGTACVLIAAFDAGQQAVNYCEHSSLPTPQEMGRGNQAYDSLRFQFQGDEAVFVIDPTRLVPLYAAQISLDTQ
jgi:hypothetical protein